MARRIDAPKVRELAKGNAISKVCSVLSALTMQSPMRLNEISDATGLNRVTALRILEELGETGFISRAGSPPRYDFGPEIVAMSAAASRSFNVRNAVRPSLLRLADLTGDTILLSVRSGAESIVVDRVVGDYPIRANFLDIGSRRPLGVGGGSMALLAWLPQAEQEAVLDITVGRLDIYPRIDRPVLERHIAEARERGFVAMYDIVVEKMGAIGLPLRDAQGQVVAAISIVALSERIAEREAMLVDALNQEARAISRQLTL
jgi:DNA-binding IclR family transcriptional regulator